MNICNECESLIPEYYHICPVCSSDMTKTKKLTFIKKEAKQDEIKELGIEVVQSDTKDLLDNFN